MSHRPNAINLNQLEWTEQSHGKRFQVRRKQLGSAAGGKKLGCSLYEVPPGSQSWPYHYHYANEEAIFVLEGTGTLRLAGEEIVISQGDYIALLAEPSGAHQVINTSTAPLHILLLNND
jgi:uncharacterized cupin superfamily protein